MRFRFNLHTHTLKIAKDDHFLVLEEPFPTLGGVGFSLDPQEPPNRWIIFKVNQTQVKAVYKDKVYYGKVITHPPGGIVEVEFSEWDQIKKNHA